MVVLPSRSPCIGVFDCSARAKHRPTHRPCLFSSSYTRKTILPRNNGSISATPPHLFSHGKSIITLALYWCSVRTPTRLSRSPTPTILLFFSFAKQIGVPAKQELNHATPIYLYTRQFYYHGRLVLVSVPVSQSPTRCFLLRDPQANGSCREPTVKLMPSQLIQVSTAALLSP